MTFFAYIRTSFFKTLYPTVACRKNCAQAAKNVMAKVTSTRTHVSTVK